jgi:hypothetical protein
VSDKSTAHLVGLIFDLLAEQPGRHKKLAHEVWVIVEEANLDFHPNDMDSDESLIKLGLASTKETRAGDVLVVYEGVDD